MDEPSSPAPAESLYDLRGGAGRLARTLRLAAEGWLLPSTWRATKSLVLWLAMSYLLTVVALAGLLASLVTGWVTNLGVAVRGSLLRLLAELIGVDRRRLAELSGADLDPLVFPRTEPGASSRDRRRSWAQSPSMGRLPAYAFIRCATATLAAGAAVAWWWGTILGLEISIRRLEMGLHPEFYAAHYDSVRVLGVLLRPGHLSLTGAILLVAAGIVGVLLWPAVPRAASEVDVALVRWLTDWLLAPSTSDLSREVVRLSETRAQAVTASDTERRRIERDLHDGFQPQLVNLALNLGLARSRLASDPDGARLLLDRAHEDAKRATEDLRDLVRGIHPSVLDERGLDAAFSALAASSSVRLQIDVHLDRRPPREAEATAYFVVSEAVTNVNKHARARIATITVSEIEGSLRVLVQDDGHGGARPEAGGGLAGLTDRIAGVDGTFSITSPEGGPTWIEARIPCGQ